MDEFFQVSIICLTLLDTTKMKLKDPFLKVLRQTLSFDPSTKFSFKKIFSKDRYQEPILDMETANCPSGPTILEDGLLGVSPEQGSFA